MLLGCVADRWSSLLGHLMSVSYEFPTMSRLYHEVFSLPLRKSPDPFLNEGLMNAKVIVPGLFASIIVNKKFMG